MDSTTASLSIRRVSLSTLHLDPANARQHGERNLESIKASLARSVKGGGSSRHRLREGSIAPRPATPARLTRCASSKTGASCAW